MELILATRNQGKVAELKRLLKGLDIKVLSMNDVEELPEILEDGDTFFENAMKKARTVAEATGLMALADDSGLEVDALNGAPGVRSARFAGPEASDADNNRKLLQELRDVPEGKRSSRFRCVMVLYHPSGRWISAEGSCEGMITQRPRGNGGFGYDPIFFVPEMSKTMAQIGPEEKNRISHRGGALRELKKKMPSFLQSIEVSR